MRTRVHGTILAPPERVYAVFLDIPTFAKVFHKASAFEWVGEQRSGVGVTWNQRLPEDEENENPGWALHRLIECEPSSRVVMTSEDKHSFETFTFLLQEVADGTHIDFELKAKNKGLLEKVISFLFRWVIRSFMRKDLARLKEWIEHTPEKPSR